MSSFDPAAFANTLLATAARHDWQSHQINPIGTWQRPWFSRPSPLPNSPRLYISAGVHGDEPAGPAAALELLRTPELFHGVNIALFPMVNPAGLAAATRENANGVDINRDYRDPKTDEARGHIETLKTLGQFDLTICLHEDWEAKGVYVYELNLSGRPAIVRDILSAMSRHVPIETSPVIDDFDADHGAICRDAEFLKTARPVWAEARYLIEHHSHLGYTLETPSKAAPIELRVAAHLAGVEVAINFLRRNIPYTGGSLPSPAQ